MADVSAIISSHAGPPVLWFLEVYILCRDGVSRCKLSAVKHDDQSKHKRFDVIFSTQGAADDFIVID